MKVLFLVGVAGAFTVKRKQVSVLLSLFDKERYLN